MTNSIIETSQQRAAKVAGFVFLFIVIGSILHGTLVLFKLSVAENAIATGSNIITNQLQFRIGLTFELFMSIGAIVLALALYIILKGVNRHLALLALYLKLSEAILVAVIVLLNFTALQFLNGQAYLAVIEVEQLQAISGFLYNVHTSLYSIPMSFLGMSFMLFFYLLFQSKYVSRMLAGFGIVSYLFIFIFALIIILVPEYKTVVLQTIFWVPSIIFEFLIGIRLLIKGLNVSEK